MKVSRMLYWPREDKPMLAMVGFHTHFARHSWDSGRPRESVKTKSRLPVWRDSRLRRSRIVQISGLGSWKVEAGGIEPPRASARQREPADLARLRVRQMLSSAGKSQRS